MGGAPSNGTILPFFSPGLRSYLPSVSDTGVSKLLGAHLLLFLAGSGGSCKTERTSLGGEGEAAFGKGLGFKWKSSRERGKATCCKHGVFELSGVECGVLL